MISVYSKSLQKVAWPLVYAVLKQLVPRQKTLAGQLVACVTVSFGTVQLY